MKKSRMIGFRMDEAEAREARICLAYCDTSMQQLLTASVRLFLQLYKERPAGHTATESLRRFLTAKIKETKNENTGV